MASHAIAIQAKGLGRRYGAAWLFAHMELTIRRGEAVALFGNNGSGKTTLLKMIATLLPLSSGHLEVLGYDVTRDKQKIRSRLRLLGHEKRLYDRLSAIENLRLAARIRGLASRKNEPSLVETLQRFQIHEARDRPVHELSEGMKKRLVLAQLLLGDPELILLDEPHPTLDTQGRAILNELLKEWRRQGKTLLLASHDHEEVLHHVDRLLILEGGELRYDGAPIDPAKIL